MIIMMNCDFIIMQITLSNWKSQPSRVGKNEALPTIQLVVKKYQTA